MIGDDRYRLPAQPVAISFIFISSIDRDRPFFFAFKLPKRSEILPVGWAAFTSIRPSGSLSTVTFSPGMHSEMFQQILAQRDLSFGSNGKCAHAGSRMVSSTM
jgi:hypothetical protein